MTPSRELVAEHRRGRTGVVSLQVLQEYFVPITRKLREDAPTARRNVELLAEIDLAMLDVADNQGRSRTAWRRPEREAGQTQRQGENDTRPGFAHRVRLRAGTAVWIDALLDAGWALAVAIFGVPLCSGVSGRGARADSLP